MWSETFFRQILSRGRYLRLLAERYFPACANASAGRSGRRPARHRAKAPASTNFFLRGVRRKYQRGFTLVEMIVSVALFSVVMLVSVTTLLSLVNANRKAQSLHSVMNNLNIALDSMVRAIRMGTDYHCGEGSYAMVQDCPGGDDVLAFEAYNGDTSDTGDQWVYFYDSGTKRIYKSEDSGVNLFAITAPTVTIDDLSFYVVGTTYPDTVQPKVVITVKGTAGADSSKTSTTFHIQSTAVQRALDL